MARIRSRRKRKRIAIENKRRNAINEFLRWLKIFSKVSRDIEVKCYENKFNTKSLNKHVEEL